MRYLYSFLFYIALPFIFVRLLWRSRRAPQYRQRLAERFGFCRYRLERCIWLHAVSVGETIAAIPLIKMLKANYPDIPIVVTNMTPTGSARVKAAFGDAVINVFIPYDLPGILARFLDRIRPLIVVIMETELWPNLFASCEKRQIPIVLTNARLSQKSASGYQRIPSLTRHMLKTMRAMAVQGHADAERFVELGMPRDRLTVTGNLKFDIEPPADLSSKSTALRQQLGTNRLIWIAASTHPGEDEIILAAHRIVQKTFKNALLILVPRHPERFDSVAALIEQEGFQLVRRREHVSCDENVDVFLGDTMGEMMLMYAVSDVAFVAGSFAAIGGHNMLEPAVLHKPIITGPQLYNFAEISEMLIKAKGMVVTHNAEELASQIIALFSNEQERHAIGENAYHILKMNRGALKKQFDIIQDAIGVC